MNKIQNLDGVSLIQLFNYTNSISDNPEAQLELWNVIDSGIEKSDEFAAMVMTVDYLSNNGDHENKYEIDNDVSQRIINKFLINYDELTETNLVKLVLEKENLNPNDVLKNPQHFINLLQSYFYFCLVYELTSFGDPNLLADFIFSMNVNQVDEWAGEEDFVNDAILEVIKCTTGFDIMDYESDDVTTIDGDTFYHGTIESGYDYITYCDDILVTIM